LSPDNVTTTCRRSRRGEGAPQIPLVTSHANLSRGSTTRAAGSRSLPCSPDGGAKIVPGGIDSGRRHVDPPERPTRGGRDSNGSGWTLWPITADPGSSAHQTKGTSAPSSLARFEIRHALPAKHRRRVGRAATEAAPAGMHFVNETRARRLAAASAPHDEVRPGRTGRRGRRIFANCSRHAARPAGAPRVHSTSSATCSLSPHEISSRSKS